MNARQVTAIQKEQLVLDYLEELLQKDKGRLLRMMSYLKNRILEEEEMGDGRKMSLNVLNMGRHKEKELTPAQKEVFLVIDEFWKKYGFAPSIDDVMYITGEKGRGNVARKMWRLVELGLCKGIKGKVRSIRPTYIKARHIE